MNFSPQNWLSSILSIRGMVFIFGKAALVGAVVLCVLMGDALRASSMETLPEVDLNLQPSSGQTRSPTPLESFNIIENHRVFGPPRVAAAPTAPEKPASPLKIRLVAINEMSGGARMAIIEDSAKQEQDVFDTNDPVFEQGKLVEILSDRIKIEHNGKIETVELSDVATTSTVASLAPGEAPPADQTEFTVNEAELTSALQNLPQLLSQARAVPYFRNGQSIGMRLFAIRSGSLYEKLGLKNGDIVLAVNDSSLSDPAQALKLFEQLKNERSVNVKVERNNQPTDLRYSIR